MTDRTHSFPTNSPDSAYGLLLWRTLVALVLCAATVVVCYFWVDRPVAFWVHDDKIEQIAFFKWLTFPPPMVQTWSPLMLVLLAARRAFGPLAHWQKTLVVACISLIVADQFRASLGDLFGRYWPETWFNYNPSLIGTGTYGFHPFATGDDIGSFPSGHAARILGFASVWWIATPRLRLVLIAICLPMLVSLVAMDYHFVGDVVAGSVLGGVVGAWSARIGNFSESSTKIADWQI